MKIGAGSGGFDPLHPGHIQYIEDGLTRVDRYFIILSRDDQLVEKDRYNGFLKGRKPIPYEVRKAVLAWGLHGRGEVVCNIDEDLTSCKSLAYYRPGVFLKGGDTWDVDNLPEREICERLGITVVFGVGGFDKPFSSSRL